LDDIFSRQKSQTGKGENGGAKMAVEMKRGFRCGNCGAEMPSVIQGTVSEKYLGNVICPVCGAWNDVPRLRVVEVADRFLKQKATHAELRQAVREAKGKGYTLITCTWGTQYSEGRGKTVYSLSEARRLAKNANAELHGTLCTMEVECSDGTRFSGDKL
jgi:transcription elongation factor Elf1